VIAASLSAAGRRLGFSSGAGFSFRQVDFPTVNFSHLCRDLPAVHREVGRLMFDAMMPDLSIEEVARLKRLEARARAERKRLCALIRVECRLRVDAWENSRRYSSLR
jgi:hypothetical protein